MQKLPLNYNQLFWKLFCEVRFEVTVYRYGREKDWSKPWLHVGYLIQGTESRIPDCLGFPYMGWNDQQTGDDTLSAFWAWWQFAVILSTRRELRPAILFTSCLFRSSFSVRVVHSFYPHLFAFLNYSQTSTNGHLSTTATVLAENPFIDSFLFKPLYNSHFLLPLRWLV